MVTIRKFVNTDFVILLFTIVLVLGCNSTGNELSKTLATITETKDMPTTTTLVPIEKPIPPHKTKTVYLKFERDYLDFETGKIIETSHLERIQNYTIKVAYHADRTVHSVIFQNQTRLVEIAHLTNQNFDAITYHNATNAIFTLSLIDEPFDNSRVILIRTNARIYKLGNAIEDSQGVAFDYGEVFQ